MFFFFFQAEDGIRDDLVTGVQTCALPIFTGRALRDEAREHQAEAAAGVSSSRSARPVSAKNASARRSEERRVGKECRSRWSPEPEKKKNKRNTHILTPMKTHRSN